jgi:arylsulfatase A-like enzyme
VTSRISAVRRGEWKLVVNRQESPEKPELYDLSADMAEQRNLAEVHPNVVDELLSHMKQWGR